MQYAVSEPNNETLRIEARFKNARLYNAIAAKSIPLSDDERIVSLHRINGPVKAFCELYEFQLTPVYELLNLKKSPFTVKHEYRDICSRLAAVLETEPDWLFPASLYDAKWPTLARDVDHERFVPLLTAKRENALALPPNQEDGILQAELRRIILSTLETLTPREEKVIKMRFGIDGDEYRLTDVAKEFGVTIERMRQIEAKALRKLRHKSRAHRLAQFLPDVECEYSENKNDATQEKPVDPNSQPDQAPDVLSWTPPSLEHARAMAVLVENLHHKGHLTDDIHRAYREHLRDWMTVLELVRA